MLNERFTKEHRDFSTFHGQLELNRTIVLLRPRHVCLAPECAPWCSWNRFNAHRSLNAFENVQLVQEQSREHLKICAFVCKIQLEGGNHFTMENPGTSGINLDQPEIQEPAVLDQCRFGLNILRNQEPMKKMNKLQTTSREIVKNIDGRACEKKHIHQPIEGTCHFRGSRYIAVSIHACSVGQLQRAFYMTPTVLTPRL